MPTWKVSMQYITSTLTFVAMVMALGSSNLAENSDDSTESTLSRADKLETEPLAHAFLLTTNDSGSVKQLLSFEGKMSNRNIFLLYRPYATLGRSDMLDRRTALTQVISQKPTLVLRCLRAEQYEVCRFLESQASGGGVATANYFPYFCQSEYADDLVEFYIEQLRIRLAKPSEPITNFDVVIATAEEQEQSLFEYWQLTCGLCRQFKLIEGCDSNMWRKRFSSLDEWFNDNRAFVVWDIPSSTLVVDNDQSALGVPTPRDRRLITALRPDW